MVCESKARCGKGCGKFYKKLVGVPSYAANGFAEMERGRETRRGKVVIGLCVWIRKIR